MSAILLLIFFVSFSRAAPFEVAAASPTFNDYLTDSGLKLAAGDFGGALESASRAVALSSGNPKGYVQRASCDLRLKAYADAEADATKAIELKYEKASPYNIRSAARSRLGRFSEALADADAALKYSPGSAIAHVNRAAAEGGLKAAPADILADYRRAAELDPRFRPAYEAFAKTVPGALPPAQAVAPVARAQTRSRPARSWPGHLEVSWRWAGGAAVLLAGLMLALGGPSRHRLLRVRYAGVPTAPPVSSAMSSGSVIGGRYIVGALTGKLGNVESYEARDLSDSLRLLKRVADGSSAQFLGEALARAQRAAGLKHPNVEAVESFIHEGGTLCLACQPLPGETLERLRQRLPGKKMPADAALRAMRGVCEALGAGHEAGLVHGRLKPSSLWIERGIGRVADFGLPPGNGDVYQPSEAAASVEADLYALGVCLYEALTAALPFEGAEAEILKREGRPAPASRHGELPAGLDAFMTRALAADPRHRFHSAAEFFAAFKAVVAPSLQ